MAGMSRRKYHTGIILIVWYWIALWLPHSRGMQPFLHINKGEMSISDTMQELRGTDKTLNNGNSSSTISTRKGQAGHLYFNLLEEEPESTFLVDLLSQLTVISLESIVRPATLMELIDLLTYSMWCTIVIVGTFVVGIGFIILSWRVYWSVMEASKVEPVTITFLFSIPGLRYLQNHVRYHLFETPLQPRRRFASFVGAGACKFDLNDLEEINTKNVGRKRQESIVRSEVRFESRTQQSSYTAGKQSRRKSLMKSTGNESNSSGLVTKSGRINPDIAQKRRSASPGPEVHPTPPTPSSSELSFIEVASHPRSSRSRSVDKIDKPLNDNDLSCLRQPEQHYLYIESNIAAPEPKKSISAIPQLNNSEIEFDISNYSQHASHRSSIDITLGYTSDISTIEELTRPFTPISSSTMVEEEPFEEPQRDLDQIGIGWTNIASRPPSTQTMLETPIHSTNQSLTESKLFRRFNESSLEQSKLSRYFIQSSGSVTIEVPPSKRTIPTTYNDPYVSRLQEGDLTPPPGFARRHSGQGASFTNKSSCGRTHRYSSSTIPVIEDAEDTVMPSASYHAAFINASQRRRASAMPSSSFSALDNTNEEPFGLCDRHFRARTEIIKPAINDNGVSFANWRWFIDEGTLPKPNARNDNVSSVWDVPVRPCSINEDGFSAGRSKIAPVGSGSQHSLSRVVPDTNYNRSNEDNLINPFRRTAKEEARINLGIFNDIFSRPI